MTQYIKLFDLDIPIEMSKEEYSKLLEVSRERKFEDVNVFWEDMFEKNFPNSIFDLYELTRFDKGLINEIEYKIIENEDGTRSLEFEFDSDFTRKGKHYSILEWEKYLMMPIVIEKSISELAKILYRFPKIVQLNEHQTFLTSRTRKLKEDAHIKTSDFIYTFSNEEVEEILKLTLEEATEKYLLQGELQRGEEVLYFNIENLQWEIRNYNDPSIKVRDTLFNISFVCIRPQLLIWLNNKDDILIRPKLVRDLFIEKYLKRNY